MSLVQSAWKLRHRRIAGPVILGFLIAGLLSQPAAMSARGKRGSIVHVYIDSEGALHLVDAAGHDAKASREKDQVAFSSPQIAGDSQTVGWLAEFPNCCTSYPIPLTLVIYRDGKIIQQLKPGMMIVDWRFWAEGKQVAFCTNTVHGDFAPRCELRDVKSANLLEQFDGNTGESSRAWMDGLNTD
jgi:hypothetical protein